VTSSQTHPLRVGAYNVKKLLLRYLEADIRRGLKAEVALERPTDYGRRYEIRMTLQTPSGEPLTVRTIWQIDIGTEVPRLLTLYPD
jgi:hypothetical protein